jgi:hypothetical protein
MNKQLLIIPVLLYSFAIYAKLELDPIKIAYVYPQELMGASKGTDEWVDLTKEYQKKMREKYNEIMDRQEEYKKLRNDYEKNAKKWESPEKRKQQEDIIHKKEVELQTLMSKFDEEQMHASQDLSALYGKTLEEIMKNVAQDLEIDSIQFFPGGYLREKYNVTSMVKNAADDEYLSRKKQKQEAKKATKDSGKSESKAIKPAKKVVEKAPEKEEEPVSEKADTKTVNISA